jgi:hypothetical protein
MKITPLTISLASSIAFYAGFRMFSDNGKELSMIKKSISLNEHEIPQNASLVKMQGVVGKLTMSNEDVDYSSQYSSGNRIMNDVQFYPLLASRSSFVYSKPTSDNQTGEYVYEYGNDNNIMAYVFDIEEKQGDEYKSRSQWIIARPGFAAQAVDNFESGATFLNFVPTSHRVFDLDVFQDCYLEYPQSEDSSYTVATTAPFSYVPPQNKRELIELLVNNGKISYPKEWSISDLEDNVKAHIIVKSRATPIRAGQQVRITEGFVSTGDRIFLSGKLYSTDAQIGDEFKGGNLDQFTSNEVVPGIRCKLIVSGKSEREYTRELHTEVIKDTASASTGVAVLLYGLKFASRFNLI